MIKMFISNYFERVKYFYKLTAVLYITYAIHFKKVRKLAEFLNLIFIDFLPTLYFMSFQYKSNLMPHCL